MTSEKLRYELEMELNRRDFWRFCLFYDLDFFTKRNFLKQVADGFQLVFEKKIKTLSVSMPPRAGKSYITSLYCAWWMGNNETQSVMRNSCTATLFRKLSYDVRHIVKSEAYKKVFPFIKISDDKQNVDGWNLATAKQISYFGAGVGGTIIGFGANIAISDDLYKGIGEAMSYTVNESTHTWKQSSHNSRMEKDCPEIFIGTRWTKTDIIGSAIEKGLDCVINIPALNESNESFCEYVKSTAEYLKIKHDTDELIWEAEYQQNPIESKGLLFPKSSLNFYNPKTVDVAKIAEFKFTFIDPADEGGDDLAAPAAYLVGNKIYITDVIYNKDGTDVNEPACVHFIINHKLNAAEIEGNSAWLLFAKVVRNKVEASNLSDCEIRVVKQFKNKHTRILAQSAFVRNNFIFREDYEDLPQYRRFIENLTQYMRVQEGSSKNKHEDAVDSCAGIAKYFATNFAHLY